MNRKRKKARSLKIRLDQLFLDAQEEEVFKSNPAFEIADYFRMALKRAGYTITRQNWRLTKEAAIAITTGEYSYIELPQWKKCIDWCFSDDVLTDKFWSHVTFVNLGTVVKAFNAFRTSSQRKLVVSMSGQRGVIDYGKLRGNKNGK